jgi:hypothetical protein
MNSAFKLNSTMTLLFQNVLELFSSYTNKIVLLKEENVSLRSKLDRLEKKGKRKKALDYVSTGIAYNEDEDDEELVEGDNMPVDYQCRSMQEVFLKSEAFSE